MQRPKLTSKNILTAILVISVIARIASAVALGNEVVNMPGTFDQISYHQLALRVIGGHGFSFGQEWWPQTAPNAPTAHWSFLYTLYLCGVYLLFGPHPLVARILQAVIVGILHPFLTFWLGRRLFNETVGLAAAAITAVYAYFVYYGGALMTEPFYITAILGAICLSILLTARITERQGADSTKRGHGSSRRAAGSARRPAGSVSRTAGSPSRPAGSSSRIYWLAAALGLVLGCIVLLRQLFLLFVPFLFLWILWVPRKKNFLVTLSSLAVAGVVMAAMVLPFTMYNYARFKSFVLLNTNAGYAFFWANHPIYGTQFVPILTPEMPTYQELIPTELRHLDEAALDKALMSKSMQYVVEDPLRYLQLSLSRLPVFFMFWPSSGSGMISNIARVGSFGIFWPFMLYGVLLALLSKKYPLNIASPMLLILAFAVVYTGIHILSWALIRYRLPVDAVLLIFAGLALVDLYHRVQAWRHHSRIDQKTAPQM